MIMWPSRERQVEGGSMIDEDSAQYAVVINDEEQYSIWLSDRPPPAGWREVGMSGSKAQCLNHIETVWTDLRPRSLRQWLSDQSDA
jgi:MbtH protein